MGPELCNAVLPRRWNRSDLSTSQSTGLWRGPSVATPVCNAAPMPHHSSGAGGSQLTSRMPQQNGSSLHALARPHSPPTVASPDRFSHIHSPLATPNITLPVRVCWQADLAFPPTPVGVCLCTGHAIFAGVSAPLPLPQPPLLLESWQAECPTPVRGNGLQVRN